MFDHLSIVQKIGYGTVALIFLVLCLYTCSSPKKDDYKTKCQAFCQSVDSDVIFCDKDKKIVICQ